MIATPGGAPVGTPGVSAVNKPLDPKASDTDLVLSWVDLMIRTPTPLVERMTFFWHSLWANSGDEVDGTLLYTQNALLRKYGDLGANPNADVRSLAHALTIDPSMLRYLTGESNVRGKPNENYAREIMELFLLGVVGPNGTPNYTEQDVKELARAYSGWRINQTNPDDVKSYFTPSRWDNGLKTALGKTGPFNEKEATEVVLAHASHPYYMVNRLWDHFVATPAPPEVVASLMRTYTLNQLKIRPVVRQILASPQMYASLDEPNMIKPPVVYTVGLMRALKLGITSTRADGALDSMGQRPYFPPTVAGWEGGTSWLNTNTLLARYRFVADLVGAMEDLKTDQATESPQAAYDRALTTIGKPWLSAGTKGALLDYANRAPVRTVAQRKSRQIVLRTLMLAGPDAQVM